MNTNIICPLNIGNPYEITIKDLATKIIELTNSSSKLVYLELPKDDPTNRKPCLKKTKQILKWNPTIDLNEGLQNTIEYFKNC